MTIQELGSLGELIAAVATVATLVYLALQIRANTTALRIDAGRAERDAAGDYSLAIINSSEVARIFSTGLADPSTLSPEDTTRFIFLLGRIIGSESVFFEEASTGFVSMQSRERRKVTLRRYFFTPGGRWFWERFAGDYPEKFRDYVDDEILITTEPAA